MKKIIIILLFTLINLMSHTSANENKGLNYYLSQNFKIISEGYSNYVNSIVLEEGYFYFVLEKKISDGFRKLETGIERAKITEVVVCRVPVANFEESSDCKKP